MEIKVITHKLNLGKSVNLPKVSGDANEAVNTIFSLVWCSVNTSVSKSLSDTVWESVVKI